MEIKNGKENKIIVGNLDVIRTILDVRDMVNAYWISTQKCSFGEAYNIGSETPLSMKYLLDKLIELSGVDVSIQEDPKLIRPSDTSSHIPNVEKFKLQTNWKPKILLNETLSDLLNYWKKQIS